MITVELGHERKYRNASEYRNIQTATCCNEKVTGDGMLVAPAIKAAIKAGHDVSGDVMVYRNGTLCFAAVDCQRWLAGNQFGGEQPECLKR